MLRVTPAGARRGVTLIELLITMTVAGVVLGLVAAIGLRQQRTFSDLAEQTALAAQLRDAAAVLPIDLRAVAAAAGDIRDARDTSLELRATIAAAVVCDTANDAVVLAPATDTVTTFAGFLSAIEAGDTAWTLASADSGETWTASRVVAAGDVSGAGGAGAPGAGDCAARGPRLGAAARAADRVSLTLSPVPANPIGLPLRVTRQVRYSLYKASDGGWYLGAKDWNAGLARFNTVQPVAGPFLSASAGGVVFRYADSAGVPLASPVSSPSSIALVQVELRGQTKEATRVLGAARSLGKRTDSTLVAIALRNRR